MLRIPYNKFQYVLATFIFQQNLLFLENEEFQKMLWQESGNTSPHYTLDFRSSRWLACSVGVECGRERPEGRRAAIPGRVRGAWWPHTCLSMPPVSSPATRPAREAGEPPPVGQECPNRSQNALDSIAQLSGYLKKIIAICIGVVVCALTICNNL